jgi:hypothetical protein
MRTPSAKYRKGSAAIFAVIIVLAVTGLVTVLANMMMMQATGTAAWDRYRQLSLEKNIMGLLAKESILGVSELQPSPVTPGNANTNFQASITSLNANQAGVTYEQTTGFNGFTTPVTWPSAIPGTRVLNAAGTINASTFGGWQMALSLMGPYYAENTPSLTTTTVTRSVNGVVNRNFLVESQSIFAPLSNFTIGYSLPSQGLLATAAPALTSSWAGASGSPVNTNSWGGVTRLLALTTQKPGAASDCDPAVASYCLNPAESTNRLSYANNRELNSLCWTAWDFIWSKWFQMSIRYTAAAQNRLCDISSFPVGPGVRAWTADAGAGSWIDPTTKIVDIDVGTLSGSACVIDALGTARIRLRTGLNQTTPIYIQILGSKVGVNQTALEISQNINRPIIIIAQNCMIDPKYVTMRGSLWCDKLCTGYYDGSTSESNPNLIIRGSYAFSAATPPPNLCPRVDEDQAALTSIAPISPQQTLVGIRVTHD